MGAQEPIPEAATVFTRLPRHVGFIPDGNRRWAERNGQLRRSGYAAGVKPGLDLLDCCLRLGIEEVSVYGFTKENVHRPQDQVRAFREACVLFARQAMARGAALLAVGDTRSELFPQELKAWSARRSPGRIRVNLLVNYGWQWDLAARTGPSVTSGSLQVSRVDLLVRWGGRSRLSGFLPMQCAYADIYVVDTLWPDMRLDEFVDALRWYERQEVTLGG